VVEYLLDFITEKLNIKYLSPQLPKPFQGYFDEEKYAKSQQYYRENSRLGLVQNTIKMVIIIPFILLGGFNYIDQLVQGLNYNSIFSGLLYIFLLIILVTLLGLPFSIYSTFVIEEKYGFNKTTVKTFILDILKSLILFLLLGGPLLAAVLWFFEKTGSMAPLYIWCVVVAFQIFITYIAPVVILPLFNRFVPLEEGELKVNIETYAKAHHFRLKGIYKMDGSKRSTKANAIFTGFGRSRRIILYDTLIEKHTKDELLAILAHEMGHYKLHHITKNLVLSFLETGFMLFILSFFINNRVLFEAFKMQELSIYASLIFFGFLYVPISVLLSIIKNYISRKMEYQADAFSVSTTGKNKEFKEALKKLSVDNFSNLNPHPLKVFLYYSHPPILERLKAI
jgi:STE24 endopeptidase